MEEINRKIALRVMMLGVLLGLTMIAIAGSLGRVHAQLVVEPWRLRVQQAVSIMERSVVQERDQRCGAQALCMTEFGLLIVRIRDLPTLSSEEEVKEATTKLDQNFIVLLIRYTKRLDRG